MVLLRSSATTALISRSTLIASARAAVDAGGGVVDLRRDAYGHGLLRVARATRAAGAVGALVDGEEQVRMLKAEGIDATAAGEADVSAELLYGLPDGADDGRRPVMRLIGRVMSIKALRRGEAVSYGYTHRAQDDTKVALVTGGYAQAVVRALGNHARVEVQGELRPIVGRVAMDVCVVDVGATSSVEPGAEVTYFGGAGPARAAIAEWAETTGLTPAELVCAAGLRATRAEEA